ncbi:hypothetical protein TNCV_3518001 [Trichonephila clavipes]|nr:hypothetical protein TNCV_3518001 [Trichonephila clavipes]
MEWNDIVVTDQLCFCLPHHDGRIRVSRHRGDRLLNRSVRHLHTGPASVIMYKLFEKVEKERERRRPLRRPFDQQDQPKCVKRENNLNNDRRLSIRMIADVFVFALPSLTISGCNMTAHRATQRSE